MTSSLDRQGDFMRSVGHSAAIIAKALKACKVFSLVSHIHTFRYDMILTELDACYDF